MEQLVFELAVPEPPRFANFLSGRNGELVAALSRFATGLTGETGMLVWGAASAGKTHLLHAATSLAASSGLRSILLNDPAAISDSVLDGGWDLVAIDRIDEASPAATGQAFTLFNSLKQRGAHFLAASREPVASMGLREDLRTRLGWGLVYEALPLADADKPAALASYASQRGFTLPADVIDYLLRHGRRDMPSLLAALVALDRQSLSSKRPITVQLLRKWLQREAEWLSNKHPLYPDV